MTRILGNNTLITKAEANQIDINSQADNYTLVLADAFKTIKMTKATANTLTIPLNSSVAFAIGTIIFIEQWGAGQVTISSTGGVTLNSAGGATKLTAQYSTAFIRKDATNTWILVGDITT